MSTSTSDRDFLSLGKFPCPTFSFARPNQAEAWRAFKLHARDYMRYYKIKWDAADDSMKGYVTFRLMITDVDDREMLDDMEDDGTLSEEDRKRPKAFFEKIEQLKIQRPENEWKYRDELMSGLKQNADETVQQLRTRIETLVNRSNFELEQLRQSYKTLALVRAVRYHEVREWIRHPDQKNVTFQQVYDCCREMEDKSLQYAKARAEGRATLAAHTAARAEAEATVHASSEEKSGELKEALDVAAIQTQRNCNFCGLKHKGRSCPAYGQTCNACGGANHFQNMCRKKKQTPAPQTATPDKEELIATVVAEVLNRLDSAKVDTITMNTTSKEDTDRRAIFGENLDIY